jgi:hypothetical protein
VFYEVACANDKGYILEQSPSGGLAHVTNCAGADLVIPGGCRLTNTNLAKARQAATYSARAKAASFDCDVSDYAPLPTPGDGGDVVELACSNRPDGGIALFAASGPEPAPDRVIGCAYARFFGYRCILSNEAAENVTLTGDLRTLGERNCAVAQARPIGITPQRHGFTEVACTSHAKGYVIEYDLTPLTPVSVLSCAAATHIGGGCRLPENLE